MFILAYAYDEYHSYADYTGHKQTWYFKQEYKFKPGNCSLHFRKIVSAEIMVEESQWKELAEAFSSQPSTLGYNDNAVIVITEWKKGICKSLTNLLTFRMIYTASENGNGRKCLYKE